MLWKLSLDVILDEAVKYLCEASVYAKHDLPILLARSQTQLIVQNKMYSKVKGAFSSMPNMCIRSSALAKRKQGLVALLFCSIAFSNTCETIGSTSLID